MKSSMTACLMAAALLAASAVSASSSEVVVSTAEGRSGSVLGLDIVSNGDVVAAQFFIGAGGVDEKAIDLSKCTAKLPKTHQGACAFKNGEVRVVVYSPTAEALPAGLVSIGEVSVRGSLAKGGLSITNVELSDNRGNPVSTAASVDGGAESVK